MNDEHTENGLSRREMLKGVAGTGVALLLPMLTERAGAGEAAPEWVNLGPSAEFALNTPIHIVIKKEPILWVTRTGPQALIAVSAKCTHRGCKVNWDAADKQFECPCHGSTFGVDGHNIHGPGHHTDATLKPLPAFPVREADGRVQVSFTPLPAATPAPGGMPARGEE